MWVICVGFFFIWILACKNNINSRTSYKTENRHRIISMNEAKDALQEIGVNNPLLFKDKVASEINEVDIKMVYDILKLSIDNYNQKNKLKYQIDIDDYRFYITPTSDIDGELVVYIKAFCFDDDEEWLTYSELSMIKDGGSCHFMTTFRVPKDGEDLKPYVIITNGEA